MKKFDYEKAIEEIKNRQILTDFGATIETNKVIQIINDNIKQIDFMPGINYYKWYHKLLDKYLKLSDRCFALEEQVREKRSK